MTKTFEMIWEEPATAHSRRADDSHLRQVLAELQKHPGRWAKVSESEANGGQASRWKKQGCEATTRRHRERGVTVMCPAGPSPARMTRGWSKRPTSGPSVWPGPRRRSL